MVKKADKSAHLEYHSSTTQCADCQDLVSLDSVDVHAIECRKRKRRCCYCDLELAWDALLEHEEDCGARTELCEVCDSFVTRKEMPLHLVECVGKQESTGKQKSERDNGNRKRIKKHSKGN